MSAALQEKRFYEALQRLNQTQRQIVETIYGSIMVIAGPWTGKTQTVALRTANILLKTDTRPENILITTFTDAGVRAIRERLGMFIGSDALRVNVSTLHGLANDLIQGYPEYFSQNRGRESMDEIAQLEAIATIIAAKRWEYIKPMGDPELYVRPIKSAIDTLMREGWNPKNFPTLLAREQEEGEAELLEIDPKLKKYTTAKAKLEKNLGKLAELGEVWQAYEAWKRERGTYDFGDMIAFTLDALQAHQELRQICAERFGFIMVDEFQDTNSAQNAIVEYLLQENEDPNILVVGDDDQSIYRFQGANLDNFLSFATRHPNTQVVTLTENYRSTAPILQAAHCCIAHNTERISNTITSIDKTLHANADYQNTSVACLRFASDVAEVAYIGDAIAKILTEENPIPSDIAILVRTNKEVSLWTEALAAKGIETQSKLQSDLRDASIVHIFLDILRTIAYPERDDGSFLALLRSGFFSNIDTSDVLSVSATLSRLNRERRLPLWLFEWLTKADNTANLPLTNKPALEQVCALFLQAIALFGSGVHTLEGLKWVVEHFGVSRFAQTHGGLGSIEDLYAFLGYARAWSEDKRGFTLEALLGRIDAHERFGVGLPGRIRGHGNGVQVLTAHDAKGLEYDTVFVPGTTAASWPKRKKASLIQLPRGILGGVWGKIDADTERFEDERRLFFVAMTRAKRRLFLTLPESIGTKETLASPFLAETEVPLQSQDVDSQTIEAVTAALLVPAQTTRDATETELDAIVEYFREYRLSPSDLNAFIKNPADFLTSRVFKAPFLGGDQAFFGRAYHSALEMFYREFKATRARPNETFLQDAFRRALSRQPLTPDGYDHFMEAGQTGLSGWYARSTGIDLDVPLEIEYDFSSRKIVWEGIPLGGKADKIVRIDSETIRIIDYKTGRIKTANAMSGQTEEKNKDYFRQVLFYAFLLEQSPFTHAYSTVELEVEFVEGRDGKYQNVLLPYTPADTETLKEEIKHTWSCLQSREFWRGVISGKINTDIWQAEEE